MEKIINYVYSIYTLLRWARNEFRRKNEYAFVAKNAYIEKPSHIESPKDFYIYENARIRHNACIINAPGERVIIKKYSVIAPHSTFITNSHKSTVGIPHCLLGISHINDKSRDIVVEEDVWVGANTTILSGVTLGRGCIVAAGALVTKDVPPYALVAGAPAKIISKKFELEDILRHEESIYPPNERMSRQQLEQIYSIYFEGKKTYGINLPLTEEQKNLLTTLKKRIQYTNWND